MNARSLLIVLGTLALCVLIALYIGGAFNRAPGAIPQEGYIPPAPPSAAPAILTLTPPPSITLVSQTWTPTPTRSPLPFTVTPTAIPSSTPTAVSISPTPAMGPDTNTRGDPPPTAPTSGGAPANISLLAQFLLGLASGGLTFKAADFIFEELAWQGIDLDKRRKRLAAYALSFGLAIGALAVAAWLGYVEWNAENIFGACLAAFATSQALHGTQLDRPEEQLAPFAWGK